MSSPKSFHTVFFSSVSFFLTSSSNVCSVLSLQPIEVTFQDKCYLNFLLCVQGALFVFSFIQFHISYLEMFPDPYWPLSVSLSLPFRMTFTHGLLFKGSIFFYFLFFARHSWHYTLRFKANGKVHFIVFLFLTNIIHCICRFISFPLTLFNISLE